MILGFLKKHGTTILAVIIVAILLVVVKMQYDAARKREAINREMIEMKQLADNIVRNQSKYVSSEDLEKFAEKLDLNLDAIKKDMGEYDAKLVGIGNFVAQSLGRNQTNIPSSGWTPRPTNPEDPPAPTCPDGTECPDPYGYQTKSQHLALSEPFPNVDVPIGSVTFDAWKKSPWSMNIFPRKYHVSTVLGQDADGRHYVYNQMQIEADGKRHKVQIGQAEFQEKFPDAEFHFNPKIHLGVDVGAVVTNPSAEVIPNAQVSLFSYGKTKTNAHTEWSFVGLGLGYGTQNQTFNVLLTPVNYNLGQHIPLIETLNVGPTISVDHKGEFSVLGGIRVSL